MTWSLFFFAGDIDADWKQLRNEQKSSTTVVTVITMMLSVPVHATLFTLAAVCGCYIKRRLFVIIICRSAVMIRQREQATTEFEILSFDIGNDQHKTPFSFSNGQREVT